jgi:hypothetical protein
MARFYLYLQRTQTPGWLGRGGPGLLGLRAMAEGSHAGPTYDRARAGVRGKVGACRRDAEVSVWEPPRSKRYLVTADAMAMPPVRNLAPGRRQDRQSCHRRSGPPGFECQHMAEGQPYARITTGYNILPVAVSA